MTVIGITGPSGAGKGEAVTLLCEKLGFASIDADAIYHSLVSAPSECVSEICTLFGGSVINPDGSLDRRALSGLVLGEENRERLSALNSIAHKHVVSEIRSAVADYRSRGISCIIDAPLLIEAGLTLDCDLTIAILADTSVRAERIIERDKLSHNEAMVRISSQKPDGFYIKNTDYLLYNNGSLVQLSESLDKLLLERGVTV